MRRPSRHPVTSREKAEIIANSRPRYLRFTKGECLRIAEFITFPKPTFPIWVERINRKTSRSLLTASLSPSWNSVAHLKRFDLFSAIDACVVILPIIAAGTTLHIRQRQIVRIRTICKNLDQYTMSPISPVAVFYDRDMSVHMFNCFVSDWRKTFCPDFANVEEPCWI